MPTLNQLVHLKTIRKKKKHKIKSPALRSCPQKKAICVRVYTTKPKKPNSAIRKIAKVLVSSTKRYATVYIPGQGHRLHEHSVIYFKGGRIKDLPGIKYRAIRGKMDFSPEENFKRKQRRSKFSIKSDKK